MTLALSACERCGGDPPIAELAALDGAVEADRAGGGDAWEAAPLGRRFVIDEGVRTGPASTADLDLSRGGHLHVDPETVVRFERSRSDEASRLMVEVGSTTIEAPEGQPIEVETVFGVARVEAYGRARLGARGRLEVIVGRATLEAPGATIIEIGEGQIVDESGNVSSAIDAGIDAGEDAGIDSGIDANVDAGTDANVDAFLRDDVARGSDGPFDIGVRAGESLVVHDPGAPTRVRFVPTAEACAQATWSMTGAGHADEITASGPFVLELRPGNHGYEVRCDGGGTASGSVRVDRDSGRTPMPRTAPRTVVDADCRPYSVLYQTLLPEIVFRWPHAPSAAPYTIEVASAGRAARTVTSATASHTFESGELAEGTHALSFLAADGSRSARTTLRIRFDNATPVATIRAPLPGDAVSGAVPITLVVEEGATVTIDGASASMDAAGRVETTTTAPASGCIDIRVTVPGRGTHVFVRCPG